MLDYEFMRIIGDYTDVYNDFPLPAVICDRAFQVYWSNEMAKSLYPAVTDSASLSTVLAKHPPDAILRQVDRNGSCTLSAKLPLDGVSIGIYPMLSEGRPVGVILLLAAKAAPSRDALSLTLGAAQALNASIRECIDDIFGTMDIAAMKADFLDSGWIKASFDRIGTASYRLLRVAGNIAEYNQLQGQGYQLRRETLDMGDVLGDMQDTVSELGKKMGIPITFDIPREPCLVYGDRRLLELAVLNIFHNSLYYTSRQNAVMVAVAREGTRALLTIRDRGVGIPLERQEAVWEPYVAYSHGGVGAGIGLGLAVIRLVAAAHGGNAAMVSVPGGGTALTLRLPTAQITRPLRLAQRDNARLADRFSSLYTGLVDAENSPYREADAEP